MSLTDREALENRFGADQIKEWADPNNKGIPATINARIAWAISEASNWFLDRMRGGPYLTFSIDQPTVKRCVTLRAATELYSSRGRIDTPEGKHILRDCEKEAEDIVKGLRTLKYILDDDEIAEHSPSGESSGTSSSGRIDWAPTGDDDRTCV